MTASTRPASPSTSFGLVQALKRSPAWMAPTPSSAANAVHRRSIDASLRGGQQPGQPSCANNRESAGMPSLYLLVSRPEASGREDRGAHAVVGVQRRVFDRHACWRSSRLILRLFQLGATS